MQGGRNMLTKILKGSRDKKIIELGLDKNPMYGYYIVLPVAEILNRIDWVIRKGYLDIEYDGRLPMLVYTPEGWDIERETYACELFANLDRLLAQGPPYHMEFLKDRNREVLWRLLQLVEASGNPNYIPLLEAWAEVDYRKVRQRISMVIQRLSKRSG
jgi:hypothetical protein